MDNFEEFWRILCDAFPENEHRSREDHQALLNNPIYQLNYIREEDRIIGFYSIWNLGRYIYMEHLALDSCCRGKGYGSVVFQQIFRTAEVPFILEVERPETEEARRRIEFYQRLGLKLNPFDYVQPAMQKGCDSVPMYLMSWPEALDEAEFYKARKLLYEKVYGIIN